MLLIPRIAGERSSFIQRLNRESTESIEAGIGVAVTYDVSFNGSTERALKDLDKSFESSEGKGFIQRLNRESTERRDAGRIADGVHVSFNGSTERALKEVRSQTGRDEAVVSFNGSTERALKGELSGFKELFDGVSFNGSTERALKDNHPSGDPTPSPEGFIQRLNRESTERVDG